MKVIGDDHASAMRGAPFPSAGRYVELAPAAIEPSPHNHRKTFTGLEELAASMREKGVVSPITVRPFPDGKLITHQLVVGERRWRAAKIAKLPVIPAIERDITDKEVLEIQLIENVQRVDVHPLEEADGYKDLIDHHGYDVDQIAAKTGKSKAYVYARLKLCSLAPVPRKSFLDDKLNAELALMIARIPDAKLQAQATKEILGEAHWQDYRVSGVEHSSIDTEDLDGKRITEAVPLSVREARLFIRKKYMLRLDQAPFEVADVQLLPKAGACTTCPHRTGNQRELFSDVPGADVCTNPPCFELKKKAQWDRKAAEATRSGQRVLNAKETKNVFHDHSPTRVSYDAAYVDPNDTLPYDLNPGGKTKTWGQLLGKDVQPATVLALDGAGVARTLIDKKSAIAKLEKAGKLKELKREAKASRTPNKYDDTRRKQEAENKRRHKVARMAFAELAGNAGSDPSAIAGIDFWRWLARSVLRMIDAEDCRNLCKRRELETKLGGGDAEKALAKLVAEAKQANELVALVVEFVAAFRAVGGLWAGKNYGDNFTAACELFEIDLASLKAEVVKQEKDKAT